MYAKRIAMLLAGVTTLCAGQAHAQLFGNYSSYPVVGPAYSSPCATGNCPTSPYVSSYPSSNCPGGVCTTGSCPNGNCPTGACANGQCSTGCRTICGPNGCQKVCPTGVSPTGYNSPCGPNGCPTTTGVGPASYIAPARQFQSLNLDQAPMWNGNAGINPNVPVGNYGRPNFSAPMNSFQPPMGGFQPQMNQYQPPMNNFGSYPGSADLSINGDPTVHLN